MKTGLKVSDAWASSVTSFVRLGIIPWENTCQPYERIWESAETWVLILALSPVSRLIILLSVKWWVWTSWTWRSLTALTVYGFYLCHLFRINFLKMHIEIRGNILPFLRTELTGNNTGSVLVISREGYRLRDLMDTTGVFLHQLSLMPGHVSICEQALLSICFCVWTKYEGDNLQGTQSCGREGNKKKNVWKHLLFWFLRKTFSSSHFRGIILDGSFFWELPASSPLYPKSKVKILTKWLFTLVQHNST